MNIKGTLTYCNHCGFKIFRKGKISFSEYGASTYFEDIDPVPEDWANYGDEHLCPQCAKEWKKAIRATKEE